MIPPFRTNLDNSEREIAYCLEYILNFTGSLDYAAVFVSPLQHLVHRHSGHVASPGPSSALCWCLGSDPSVSQEDLGMMTSTGRRIYDVDNYVNDLSMYIVINYGVWTWFHYVLVYLFVVFYPWANGLKTQSKVKVE